MLQTKRLEHEAIQNQLKKIILKKKSKNEDFEDDYAKLLEVRNLIHVFIEEEK